LRNFTFNHSSFFVAPHTNAARLPQEANNFNEIFQDVGATLQKAILWIILAIASLIALTMIFATVNEYWKWQRLRQKAYTLTCAQPSFDPIDLIYRIRQPISSSIGYKMASWTFRDMGLRTAARWTVSYISNPPAVFCLALGVVGLISCLIQYELSVLASRETPSASVAAGNWSKEIEEALANTSSLMTNQANQQINSMSDQINQQLFGWVDETVVHINDSLNVFVDTMMMTLNQTFGGTILYNVRYVTRNLT